MEKRSSMIIIILFLFFVTLIHLSVVTSLTEELTIQPEWTEQPDMDYYVYAQHWPGTNEDDAGSTKQTDKPTTSSSSSSKKAKSKTENMQQTDKPTTSSSSSSKGAKSKTENKQQSTSTTAGEQKKSTLKPNHFENFRIHGLWPQYSDRIPSYPEYCLKPDGGLPEQYDFSKISDLYAGLKLHWPSLASPYEDGHPVTSKSRFGGDKKVKEGIWEHEWKKHGSCSTFETQLEYFKTILELRTPSNLADPNTWINISNLLDALDEDNIIPGRSYPIGEIRKAIQKNIQGMMPKIECNAKNELYQVHICLEKKKLRLMDCTTNTVIKCIKDKEIIFPSFPEKNIDHQEL